MPRSRRFARLPLILGALLLLSGCAMLGPTHGAESAAITPQTALTHVRAADAALQRGHANAALRLVSGMPDDLPPDVRAQVLDVEARARLATGDRLGAARALVERADLLPPALRASVQHQAIAVLAGMGHDQLAAVGAMLANGDPVKPWVQQAMARPEAAAAQLLPQPNQAVGTVQGSGAPQGYTMPARIALLLPTGGRVAIAGAAVRDGFFAAYFHAADLAQPRPSVKLYDTGGTADGALTAYKQAVADGAQLVVGPLGRAGVGAIFAQASLPVPVLALNHPQGDTATPAGSFEFAMLPEAEGAQLAAHLAAMGLHTAVVFRASDDTAARTFAAFKAQFESLGGQIASTAVLPAGAVDYAAQVKSALAAAGSDSGIVVLLRPVQARLLLPQLKLAQSTLPVFATSMVYAGDENAPADGDLDGVSFCDEPWLYDAQAGLPDHATLAAAIDTAAGPAARLFAFGMDAYALVPYLGWLRTNPGNYVPGATGQLTMDASGHVQRTPIWVQFQGGVARPVAAGLEAQPATDATPDSGNP